MSYVGFVLTASPNTGLATCLRSHFEKTPFMNENILSSSLSFYGKSARRQARNRYVQEPENPTSHLGDIGKF
jgi:hypothetical protein